MLYPRSEFFKGGQKSSSFPSGAILPPMKIFVPPSPLLKIESAPDEKNPGHASAYYYIFL